MEKSKINRKNLTLKCGLWVILTYLITAIHHIYTGIIYNTVWRVEFSYYAIIPTILCVVALFGFYKIKNKIFLIVYLLISFIFFFLIIGVWEGAWCHTIKLIFYFLNIPFQNAPSVWNIPTAPAPKNFFSELTGVLNFIFSSISLYFSIKLHVSYFGRSK